jgi:hypothetical protein
MLSMFTLLSNNIEWKEWIHEPILGSWKKTQKYTDDVLWAQKLPLLRKQLPLGPQLQVRSLWVLCKIYHRKGWYKKKLSLLKTKWNLDFYKNRHCTGEVTCVILLKFTLYERVGKCDHRCHPTHLTSPEGHLSDLTSPNLTRHHWRSMATLPPTHPPPPIHPAPLIHIPIIQNNHPHPQPISHPGLNLPNPRHANTTPPLSTPPTPNPNYFALKIFVTEFLVMKSLCHL